MSKHNPVAKAIHGMFEEHGPPGSLHRLRDDGRICPINNVAKRALRGIGLGLIAPP